MPSRACRARVTSEAISNVSRHTFAVIAPLRVGASCVGIASMGLVGTLIDVGARYAISAVADVALTVERTSRVEALGV